MHKDRHRTYQHLTQTYTKLYKAIDACITPIRTYIKHLTMRYYNSLLKETFFDILVYAWDVFGTCLGSLLGSFGTLLGFCWVFDNSF